MALVAYTPSGTLDDTFGVDGIATISVAGQASYLRDIVVDDDNNIIVAGYSDDEVTLVRFTPAGGLDTTFGGGNGYITESIGTTASSVALQSDGQIVISGVATNGTLLVARFNPNGTLDGTFGPNGQGYADDFAYSPEGISHSVLIQSNGQIVLNAWNDTENVVVRYNANGTPDTTF